MEKGVYNCDEIKKASRKVTVNVYLPYKTPILQGAIRIINEIKKKNQDGIDYKKLCEELSKYINVQKGCIDPNLKSYDKTTFPKQWKDIIEGVRTTFTSNDINRLCYWEGDKKEKDKKYVLDLHDKFRNFCIEKKKYEAISSNMEPDKCVNYIQWIESENEKLQSVDPGYNTIKKYQKYFNIRNNCNYPWLLKNTPDITCTVRTKTKLKEQESKDKTPVDGSQPLPDVSKDSPVGDTKDNPPTPQPSPKVEGDPRSGNPHNTVLEKTPTQGTPSGDQNVNHVHENYDAKLQGTPVDEPNPVPKSPSDKQTSPEYSDPKVQEFIKHIQGSFHGQKITHDTRHAINRRPDTIYKYNENHVQGEEITSPITKQNNSIPPGVLYSQRFIQLLHSQRFLELLRLKSFRQLLHSEKFLLHLLSKERFIPQIIHSQQVPPAIPHREFYVPKPKPIKTQVALIPAEHIFHPRITTDNKIKDIVKVKIGPAIPGPSYFRSPFMIYTLVFLTISTAITIFYLLSKYTSFGLLFNKKKKKKRLKRNLEIKKIQEESPHFDNIDNHSINDIPCENKIHDDKNIYNQMIIQKGILKKNISIPKKKKNKRKAIIDIHMELLNECKNDEWELNKNDFLQICLEQFIREQNKIYTNLEKSELIKKSISIQNTKEEKMVLWDKWTERYRHIWENFKRINAFKVLQSEWKEMEKLYLEDIEQLENNIFNKNQKIAFKEIKKDIWKRWITKQSTLIEQYKEEKWFNSLVEELKNVSDTYNKEEMKDDFFIVNIEELEHKENKEILFKEYDQILIIKVLIQILLMVIEDCIKEETTEKQELVIDNLISEMNKEKRAKIESKNIFEKKKNHAEYIKVVEEKKYKDKYNFKELMKGWTYKDDIYINSTYDKTKADKSVEMKDKILIRPHNDMYRNSHNYTHKK
ncbi:STP1 protein [Plasmodium ovale curtisi]|uniref:STP1 protein n=1 Tax=Plasmodium ovale curtisi TaxID=864141 RepID=A0A1A8WNK2_PLAOA|nr:STP1 protein [Plasmodium ovale curtisi]